MENQEQPKAQPEPAKENPINKFCREYKDLLNVGSRAGVYVAMMIIVFLLAKMATMQQITWAEEHCSCQDWGGDVITLTTQQKPMNTSNITFIMPGVTNGGTTEVG